jgi:SAM-dependent methyltransferase
MINQLKLNKLLKYGTIYADSCDLSAPAGYPKDVIDEGYLKNNTYWVEQDLEAFKQYLEKDTAPIPALQNREGYCPGHDLAYWLSGYRDYRNTLELVKPHGIEEGKYLDFGGSTGRIFRHFLFQSGNWEVWSCDFKISSVEFNLRYFPTKLRCFLNNCLPSLPIPDDYFDLITGYSVFTHINETESAWLLELRRILRIGGIAYLSIHDCETWRRMSESLRSTVARFRPDITDEIELPEGKTVVTFREDDPYNCNVFHSHRYIYKNWGRYFKICNIKSNIVGQQAVVVCCRTA